MENNMSVCGEIENLEDEIRKYQQKIRQAYDKIDRLKGIQPASKNKKQDDIWEYGDGGELYE
tara:strand:+ start:561 stop:746 length:186 start_codon:yes stop_codon:yes gene_type:complete